MGQNHCSDRPDGPLTFDDYGDGDRLRVRDAPTILKASHREASRHVLDVRGRERRLRIAERWLADSILLPFRGRRSRGLRYDEPPRRRLPRLMRFRRWIQRRYRVFIDDELSLNRRDGSEQRLTQPTTVDSAALRKHERLAIVRHFADEIARLPDVNIINVIVDKSLGKLTTAEGCFQRAWYPAFGFSDSRTRYSAETFLARKM